jgi:hypothetical protein
LWSKYTACQDSLSKWIGLDLGATLTRRDGCTIWSYTEHDQGYPLPNAPDGLFEWARIIDQDFHFWNAMQRRFPTYNVVVDLAKCIGINADHLWMTGPLNVSATDYLPVALACPCKWKPHLLGQVLLIIPKSCDAAATIIATETHQNAEGYECYLASRDGTPLETGIYMHGQGQFETLSVVGDMTIISIYVLDSKCPFVREREQAC